jgi:hypothetical protein
MLIVLFSYEFESLFKKNPGHVAGIFYISV